MTRDSLLHLLAIPLAPLYAAGVWVKNAAYDARLLRPKTLSYPVLCVGNLSVGGAGKTPMVILLARLLSARGWQVDVLSRGYGRSSRRVERVHSRVEGGHAVEEFGDEPVLMTRHGLEVFVGANRYRAGRLAEAFASALGESSATTGNRDGVHILDDGFQHRKLARTVDIVLLQRRDLEDRLLPIGRLRESLRALRRAGICVLRAEDADLKDRVLRLMGQGSPGQIDPSRVWVMERRVVLPELSPGISQEPSAIAFCAIGDPQGFFCGLRDANLRAQKEISFRDHHLYTQRDIERLGMAAQNSGATCFVTTEKDHVRLEPSLRANLERQLPLVVAGLEVRLRDEEGSLAWIESLLRD